MSPRGLVAAFSRFSRAARRQDGQASQARQRRTARPATRAPHLAAESLESRCMLSTTARLENNISMFDRIPVIHPLRPANVPTSFVGQFAWSGFNSFCVEIGQSISPGLHTFPTRAPLASSGLANAGLVADFWRSYGPKTTGFTSVTDAAAFQLGIWELISDGPSRNLKSGSFQVGASASPAVARAESWLNGTGTPAPSAGGPAVSLYVLQHPTRQDQVVWEPRGVDLDVDSNNDGRIAEDDDPIEEKTDLPGVIVPVGGSRAEMIVDVPQGRSATLAITQGADKVRLWTAQTGGTAIPAAGTTIAGGAVQTYWIEAFAPSASMADIAFTLTPTGGSPASADRIRATAVVVDLDVDSNNDGTIDPDNGPAGTDDRIEEQSPGQIIFANTDDDDGNGVGDTLDAGPVAGENDLAQILLAVAPTTALGSIIVTYDDSIVRLYKFPDRRGPIASGVATATGGRFYAEGRSAGTTLVTAAFPNAGHVTDTVRLTVQPYPGTIDVDIDSDNNNDFLPPARSEWEDILEDHEYGVGKLIMLDNPRRPLTPIVMELATGLPKNAPAVGVRINWNVLEWDALGVARQKVRLWNRVLADGVRNPAPVSEGGNQILPGIFCKLSDLNYNPQTGTITIWAEGVRENAQLKTLAGVEAAPRVDERIRGTVVVNGDDAAFDEVKYLVANEDSFYYALHTRQEVRNALASRGVYSLPAIAVADMPKFSLQPKNAADLGVNPGVAPDVGPNPRVPGLKAMIYQDYITGDRQYVLAFGGTDDNIWELEFNDWRNNIKQGLGWSAPQYTAAMEIGDAVGAAVGQTRLIVTGHSLGGGLASAAALVAGVRADTFNGAGLHEYTLYERDPNDKPLRNPMGGYIELYPGTAARYTVAGNFITNRSVDYDILTFVQKYIGRTAIGVQREMDGPKDFDLALSVAAFSASVANRNPWGAAAAGLRFFSTMVELHLPPSILYGLLVTESSLSRIQIDMLGYNEYF